MKISNIVVAKLCVISGQGSNYKWETCGLVDCTQSLREFKPYFNAKILCACG